MPIKIRGELLLASDSQGRVLARRFHFCDDPREPRKS